MEKIVQRRTDRDLYYLLFCITLLPILLLRDFTPSNELRYLSIADEAIRNQTFFTFSNHGLPYADKPPLYLWIVMLGKALLGSHKMWFLSLASLIPALITVRTMDRWVDESGAADDDERRTARRVLLLGGLFVGMTITLRMDMLMCLFIVLALRAAYDMEMQPGAHKRERWLFPIYVFLAIFSKGPVGILVPLGTTLVYLLWTKRLRHWGRIWSWQTWGVLVVLCGLWFGAVYLEGGTAYLHNLLFHQTIDRAVDAFHHQEPFYYYGIAIWYTLAPWSLLVVGLIIGAAAKGLIRSDLQRYFCSVVVATFVLLSCISSKLAVYLLPLIPFAIYLALLSLTSLEGEWWVDLLFVLTTLLFLAALPIVYYIAGQGSTAYLGQWEIYAAAAVMTLTGIAALWYRYGRKGTLAKSLRLLVYGLTATIFLGGCALPAINPWLGYGDLCAEAAVMAEEYDATGFATMGLHRAENMDALLGAPVTVLDEEQQEALLESSGGTLPSGTVLMLPADRLEVFSGAPSVVVGPYAAVLLR